MSSYLGFLDARSRKLAFVRAISWFELFVDTVSFAMIIGFGFGFGFGVVFSFFFEIFNGRTLGSETDFD